jgi:ATP-dependent DNA helicase RecQ
MNKLIIKAELTLKKYFEFTEFRSSQVEIIESIIEGNNVVAVMPTGSGKSICYQIPALMSDRFSIIISPLIALMKDQVDSLNNKEEIAGFINSTLEWYEIDKTLNKVQSNKIKLLYLAPERLESKEFAERLKALKPDFLFVDEAHCISQWGHNFRPSYTKLKNFIDYLEIKNISAFTATATPEVITDIIEQLSLVNPRLIVKGFERDNISINIFNTSNKKEKLLEILRINPTPALIYTSTRRKAEIINQFLIVNKFNSDFYHAGLHSLLRKKIQEEFIEGNIPIVVATNAFGMGIDKKNLRTVIHYDIPSSIESYYQEFGRAGRDNKPANVFLLFKERDLDIHNYFIDNSYPTKEIIQTIYNGICDYAQIAVGNIIYNEIEVNYDYLKTYSNRKLSSAVIHSSLKYLEQAGYLEINSQFITNDSVYFTSHPDRLKKFVQNIFNNELKILILFLVRNYGNKIFQSKIKIDYNYIELNTGLSQDTQKYHLNFLKDFGMIEYEQLSGKETVNLLMPRVPKESLKLSYDEINKYYLIAKDKLEKMKNIVFTNHCRFKYILNYFGQNTDNYFCGKCDNCNKLNYQKFDLLEFVDEKNNKSTQPVDVFDHLELYNKLVNVRKRVSKRISQTPNMVCPDSVLANISKVKPTNKLELMMVEGFNLRIFNKCGEDLLSEIRDYLQLFQTVKEKSIPSNITETYELFKKGFSLEEIAQLRNLDQAVISIQIETLLAIKPDLSVDKIIPANHLNLIKKYFDKGITELQSLKKEIKKNENVEISISQIRIALAKIKHGLKH